MRLPLLLVSFILSTSSTTSRSHPCRSKRDVLLRLVHVPKAGGSTLGCTFRGVKQASTASAALACQHPRFPPSVEVAFQGTKHENYHEIVREHLNCTSDVYRSSGAGCAALPPDRCEPLVVFLAHPAARFLSAFFQGVNNTHRRVRDCHFLRCRPEGELAQAFIFGRVTPSEFALWQPKEELAGGFNVATWFIGATVSTNISNPGPGRPRRRAGDKVVTRDDAAGRATLALAKARLSGADFVGLADRFDESMELMAWALGLPLERYCACNVNRLKARFEKAAPGCDDEVGDGDDDRRLGHHDHDRGVEGAPSRAGGPPLLLSPAARREVESDNALDLELYRHAARLFEQRLAQYRAAQAHAAAVAVAAAATASVGPGAARGHFSCDTEGEKCHRKNLPQGGFHNDCAYECEWKGKSLAQFPA